MKVNTIYLTLKNESKYNLQHVLFVADCFTYIV